MTKMTAKMAEAWKVFQAAKGALVDYLAEERRLRGRVIGPDVKEDIQLDRLPEFRAMRGAAQLFVDSGHQKDTVTHLYDALLGEAITAGAELKAMRDAAAGVGLGSLTQKLDNLRVRHDDGAPMNG